MSSRLVLLLSAALLVPGCLPFPGDGLLLVTGVVTDTKGRLFEKCSVELLLPPGDRSVHLEKVSGEFRIRTTGPPRGGDYIVAISCQGARTSFRSAVIEIGGKTPTNLGRITLERE